MKGSSPWTMTPTQPLSPSCLTPAPALQPLDPLVSAYMYMLCVYVYVCLSDHVCVCIVYVHVWLSVCIVLALWG